MRILVTASTFPRWANDTEPPFVFLLCKELAKKHRVTVVAPHYKGAKFSETIDGVKIRRFPYFFPFAWQTMCYNGGILANIKKNKMVLIQIPFFFSVQILALIFFSMSHRAQVLHAHWAIPQGFSAYCFRFFRNTPVVLSIHGSDVFAFQRSLLKPLLKRVINRAQTVTANSTATQKILADQFTSMSELVPMGIDTEVFFPGPKSGRTGKILAVGRLVEQKGFQYLIQALPALLQENAGLHLTVVGDGPYRQNLEKLAAQTGVKNYVDFRGSVSNKYLPEIYRSADYFVGPSVIGQDGAVEAFGVVFLEALASGLPVVATNIGGVRDIVQDGYNGFLVNQKSPSEISAALKKLMSDPELSQKLGQNGVAFVKEKFSWSKIAQSFERIYERIPR